MMESGKKPYLDDEKIAVLCEKLQCKAADVVISPPPSAPPVGTAAPESPRSPRHGGDSLSLSAGPTLADVAAKCDAVAADCAAVKEDLAEIKALLHDLLAAGGLEALRRAHERRKKKTAG